MVNRTALDVPKIAHTTNVDCQERRQELYQRCLLRSSVADTEAHLLYCVGSELLVSVVSVVSAHP
ncbi:hypothetical protein BDZ89DRAFT_1065046 [Hymenopellis radicata]|nr:hypothetical protein BDZ89DRAFT_1065046 [Hymenopellis radicata]